MLTDDAKQEIKDRLKAVSAAMSGFKSRIGQRTMIAEVAKAFGRHPDKPATGAEAVRPEPGTTILCVQGGTGVGKSLGYSLPGVIMARRKGKRLVISTATIALQEQLTQRDLPLFFKACGLEVSIELAKGRTRFLCPYRLTQVTRDMAQISMFGQDGRQTGSDEDIRKTLTSMATDFAAGRWNGDRDLRPGVDDQVWRAVTTDRHGCLGQNCPNHNRCAQVDAKKRLKAADVIVANHDLVLADLAMGGGKVLPAPSECFYIFDEGHHLPEKAVSAFASSHLLGVGQQMAQKLANLGPALSKALGVSFRTEAREIEESAGRMAESLGEAESFFASLSQLSPTDRVPNPTLDFQQSFIPEEFFGLGGNVIAACEILTSRLGLASESLLGLPTADNARKALCEKLLTDVGFYVGRVNDILSTWTLFLEETDPENPPIAKWIEAVWGKGGIDFCLHASPVRSAAFLHARLWKEVAGAVVTSATLKTLGHFDAFLRDSGLSLLPDVVCVDLPSSFDYYAQATLEIPRMRALPANTLEHTKEVAE